MHADQVVIEVRTVRALLEEQFPQWSPLEIRPVGSGTVNALFRVGEELLARFPLRPEPLDVATRRLEREAEAARELVGRTPETCFERSHRILDVPRLRRVWADLRDLPRTAPDAMTHGDLIPGNVLVAAGRLAGVLDVGGLGPADPALDLVSAWHLLEPGPRRDLREDLGCDDLEWQRGKAWAFEQAMGATWYYLRSSPPMARMGRRTLQRILADSS